MKRHKCRQIVSEYTYMELINIVSNLIGIKTQYKVSDWNFPAEIACEYIEEDNTNGGTG